MNEIDKFLKMKEINEEIDTSIKKSAWENELDELNKKYCVVQDGSRVRVHSFERHQHRGHVRLVSTFLHFSSSTSCSRSQLMALRSQSSQARPRVMGGATDASGAGS